MTKDIKFLITCGESFSLIQDPNSNKLIGAGDLKNGVYYLKNVEMGSIFVAVHTE